MAKISRPVIYILVAAVGVGAYFLTQPQDAPAKKVTTKTTTTKKSTDPAMAGFTPEDFSAHFARYAGPRHDAFLPHIVSAKAINAAANQKNAAAAGTRGTWVLTGITALDGAKTALLENGVTGESVFVKAGDHWNGQQVAIVENNAVLLVNGKGQQTELTFPSPEETEKKNRAAEAPVPTGAAGAPLGGLPPLPGAAAPANPAAGTNGVAQPPTAAGRGVPTR